MKENTKTWVIAIGNPFDGLTLYGPFKEYPHEEHGEIEDNDAYIVELKEWS